jgi:hypothetical protein
VFSLLTLTLQKAENEDEYDWGNLRDPRVLCAMLSFPTDTDTGTDTSQER